MRNMLKFHAMRAAGAVTIVGLCASPGASQQTTAPIARYTIDAGTASGMAAMGANGGGMGSAMSMMFGGGRSNVAHDLTLRLGSTLPAKGAPKADHFMPAGARLGKSVPLASPGPAAPPRESEDAMPKNFQRPKGRLLIFWGCGAHAPKGQPIVLDFAKLSAGQMPPGLFTSGVQIPRDWSILPSNSKSYGDWPNAKDRKTLSGDSSILGDHRISSNYSPDIAFSLNQDFMPAIMGRSTEIPNGAIQLSWNNVAAATGYYAWVMGFNPGSDGQAQDMVWWSSSSSQNFGGALWDWISPATVGKLITQRVVMPPAQTNCMMPAEVKQASGQFMMGNLYAYGPEANFAYPPRPADPKIAWKPDWTARVRYRSNTMWFVKGPDMGGMMRGGAEEQASGNSASPRKRCKGGLGGMLAGAAGLGDC